MTNTLGAIFGKIRKGSKVGSTSAMGLEVRITITDLRIFVGTFMAFDRHMNLVIADCEEFRRVKVGHFCTTSCIYLQCD